MPASIYILGSTNTDMTIRNERLPLPGETISGGVFLLAAGGFVLVQQLMRQKAQS